MEELDLHLFSFDECCRFCISNQQTNEVFSAPSLEGPRYSDIAEFLLGIPISQDDKYPKGLCDSCAQKLIDIQQFKLVIKNSYMELTKILMNDKSDNESVSIEFIVQDNESINEHNIKLVESFLTVPEICDVQNPEIKLNESKVDLLKKVEKKKKQNRAIKGKRFISKTLAPAEEAVWRKKLSGWIKKQDSQTTKEDKDNKIRPYVCEICGNSYTTIFSLRDHRHVHSGEMNFHCELCGKKFGTKKNLRAHIKFRHSECEMFYCEICGFAFNRRSNLNSHKWVHSNTSRYTCDYCGKSFKWKNGFDIHVNSHLKTKTYNCYICNKVFYTSSSLTKHCKRYHDGQGKTPLEEHLENDTTIAEEMSIPTTSENEIFEIGVQHQHYETELQQMEMSTEIQNIYIEHPNIVHN